MGRNLCDDCKECKNNGNSILFCIDVCGVPIDILCNIENERNKALSNKGVIEQTGWIPVGERLPENCSDVLVSFVYLNTIVVHISFYMHDEGRWAGDREVIAWMPLPEPYKGIK